MEGDRSSLSLLLPLPRMPRYKLLVLQYKGLHYSQDQNPLDTGGEGAWKPTKTS